MALSTVIPFPHRTSTAPSSYSISFSYFSRPYLLRNSFFHYPLKAPALFRPLYASFYPLKSKSHHVLHFPASPSSTLFLPSHFLSDSSGGGDFLNKADSLIDNLFHSLRLSARHCDAELARAVHASILKLEEDTRLCNALISAYLKLGRSSEAYNVLLGLSSPNVVSYTSLISGFTNCNRGNEALSLFFRMMSSGIHPNEYSFLAILTACVRTGKFELGLQVHAMVIKRGYLESVFVTNALMCLYSGSLDLALKLFDEMPNRDIASWNTVISSMVKECMFDEAFQFFRNMQASDAFRLDYITLSTLLTACTGCSGVIEGQQIHAHAIKIGLEDHLSVSNSLIALYTNSGTIEDVVYLFERMPVKNVITWSEMITAYMDFGLVDSAVKMFDEMPERNSVSYNALLAGFCRNGHGSKALNLYLKLIEKNMELTEYSLTSVVNACGLLMDCKISEQVHGFVVKFGFGSNMCIEAALLDMYTRCGKMGDAGKIFSLWQFEQDCPIPWTSMICGYARNGQLEKAISVFQISTLEGKLVMDEVASTSMLGLCGNIGWHDMGKQIHCYVLKFGFQSDAGVGNAIVSMYSKCWNMDDAIKMFENIPAPNIISWNCLITGHIIHRQGDEALVIWSKLQNASIKPDEVTLGLVISAYKYTKSNLVSDCRSLLQSIRNLYGFEPTLRHYASFVSVLGHWGLLEEAEETINKLPFEPEASIWRALLNSCRLHMNTDIGKRVAKHVLGMEPSDPSAYILISNLYAASGRWNCSEMVRESMREKGFRKHPIRSWTIVEKKIHGFYARDKCHQQVKDINGALEILIKECLKAGYVPDTSFVLHEVEEHQKKDFLHYHSAKLAATYGLLMTSRGKPIHVVKNILICGDCHSFLKYVSIVSGRDIILRDSSGFHCFSSGLCSCKDNW